MRKVIHYCRADGSTPAHREVLPATADIRHDGSDTTCVVCLRWMGSVRATS